MAVEQVQNFKSASFEDEKTTNPGHGRIEVRECWSPSHPEDLNLIRKVQNWTGLKSIAMGICTRISANKETKPVRFYLSSLPSPAQRILEAVRKHGSIDNDVHGVLEVALNEDHSRVRQDPPPENLAVLRHIALDLLKHEKTAKGAIHAQQLQAGWREH